MKRTTAKLVPRPDVLIQRSLQEYQDYRPLVIKMYEQDAGAKFERYMAFVRAGFTEDQAFRMTLALLAL